MQPTNHPSNPNSANTGAWAALGILVFVAIVSTIFVSIGSGDQPAETTSSTQAPEPLAAERPPRPPAPETLITLECTPVTAVQLSSFRGIIFETATEVFESLTPEGMVLFIVTDEEEPLVAGGYADLTTGNLTHKVLLRSERGGYMILDSRGCPPTPAGATTTTIVATTTPARIPAGSFRIPDTTGMEYNAALIELLEFDLRVERVDVVDDDVPEGIVIRTEPAAGEVLSDGGVVAVIVSSGPS